jgi:hypothetical protein
MPQLRARRDFTRPTVARSMKAASKPCLGRRMWLRVALAAILPACEVEADLAVVGLCRFTVHASEAAVRWSEFLLDSEVAASWSTDPGRLDKESSLPPSRPLPAGVTAWLDRVSEQVGGGSIPSGVELRYQEAGGLPLFTEHLIVTSGFMRCIRRKFDPPSQLHLVQACTLPVTEGGMGLVKDLASPSLWERGKETSPHTLGCATVRTWTMSGPGGRLYRSYRQDAAEAGVWPSGVAEHLCNTIFSTGTCTESRTR